MSKQRTLFDSPDAISSAASAVGNTRSSLQAGPKIVPCGLEAVPARHSRAQEKSNDARRVEAVLSRALDGLDTSSAFRANTLGTPTSDICGPNSGGSSGTASLQSSLANRLRATMDGFGSREYELRWNELATPLGPPILQRQALVRRTSGSDCSGWPTPAAQNADGGPNPNGNTGERFTLQTAATLAGWPTPKTPTGGPNPNATKREAGGQYHKIEDLIAGWPTPQTADGERGSLTMMRGNSTLLGAARLVGWASPSSRDWKDTPGMATTGINPDGSTRTRLDQLPRQATLA